MISGVVLNAPFYRSCFKSLYEDYNKVLIATSILPHHALDCKYKPRDQEFLEKYKFVYEDPLGVNVFTLMNARVWVEEQIVARQSIQQAP